jgi:hypothetical protein
MPAPFLGYAAAIHEASGVTDPEDFAEIEDSMRRDIFHSTLDWQTRAQLIDAAREAWALVQLCRDPAALAAAMGEVAPC